MLIEIIEECGLHQMSTWVKAKVRPAPRYPSSQVCKTSDKEGTLFWKSFPVDVVVHFVPTPNNAQVCESRSPSPPKLENKTCNGASTLKHGHESCSLGLYIESHGNDKVGVRGPKSQILGWAAKPFKTRHL